MPYCKTCNVELDGSDYALQVNVHVQRGHEVFVDKPKHLKLDVAHTINHMIIEPVIWAISGYGIALGIVATYSWGFFTLHEYSLTGIGLILTPNQIQQYDLWYDAYPYSLIIFGSYLLALYIKFNWFGDWHFIPTQLPMTITDRIKPHKGFLALPVFIITYATWDFLGIGANIVNGYSIIWLGLAVIGLIYYFPIRKQFEINISFIGLAIFFGFGILNLQNIVVTHFPFSHILISGFTIAQYLNGIMNELTFCLLCLLSIKLKRDS